MRPIDRYVSALSQTLRASLDLAEQLTGREWMAPTECPLWTVKDVYAHLIGGERWMAEGHPTPHDFQTFVDSAVVERRGQPPSQILAELTYVYGHRTATLADPPDPAAPANYPWGEPTTEEGLLVTRVFDCWVHEQDIRRAVGRPGGLGSPGARVARDIFVNALPRIVARRARAPRGSTVRLTVVGEVGADLAVAVDGDRRARFVPAGNAELPTAHLTLGWEAYSRLSCGRGTRDDHHVWLAGDRDLGERVLAALPITP